MFLLLRSLRQWRKLVMSIALLHNWEQLQQNTHTQLGTSTNSLAERLCAPRIVILTIAIDETALQQPDRKLLTGRVFFFGVERDPIQK